MINETNKKMLALLSEVLHNKTPDKISADDWPAIFKELFNQAVFALPSEHISDLGLSPESESQYMMFLIKNRQTFHSVLKTQNHVITILDNSDIPVIILKGSAAAINYPHPENRCMGDIDILVSQDDFVKAYEVLSSNGYKPEQAPEDLPRHICMFNESGVEVELHQYFSSSDNSVQNTKLDEMLFNAIPSRVITDVCGYPASILPPLENGLVLLGHVNQHLSTGLGLRQIIDWMFFVEKYVDDEFWENGFADATEMIGMKRLAILVTAMCQKYLGLEKDIHWPSYEPVCDELMDYILNSGNFGRKFDATEKITSGVLKQFRNPIHGLKEAQSRGLINWKASQKYPFLKPFAWCYQLGRWFRKGIKRGVNAEILSNASAAAKDETELLNKIGATRI